MKKLIILSGVVAMISLNSCLKDNNDTIPQAVYSAGSPNVASFVPGGFEVHEIANQAASQDITLRVQLSSQRGFPGGTMTLALGTAADVTAYNAANGTGFLLYPTATLPTANVTIPAGAESKDVTLQVSNSNVLNVCNNYMIPVKITSASGGTVAANTGVTYVALPIQNPYVGTYHCTGYFQHPTSPRPIDQDKTMTTINCNTVLSQVGDLGAGRPMWLTINPDNSVTITDQSGLGVAPNGPNTYNPATKTFTLNYAYPAGSPTRIINETCVHL